MQITDNTFTEIVQRNQYRTLSKIKINGVEYGEDVLQDMSIHRKLFNGDTPSIGGCVAAEIDVNIYLESSMVGRMAELIPMICVSDDVATSDWYPQGVFYVDTRLYNVDTGLLTLHGYDAILKMEQPYIRSMYGAKQTAWDKYQRTAATEICNFLGITLDNPTAISTLYKVTYPGFGEGELTFREVMGYIAASNCGNWTTTKDGKLRLVIFGDLPTETNYLLADNEGNYLTVGTGANEKRILLQ